MRTWRTWSLVAALLLAAMLLMACEAEEDEAAEADPDDQPLAFDLEDLDEEPEEDPEEEDEVDEPEEDVDVEDAVASYATTLPEGWFVESDTDAFADGLEVDDAVLIDVREEDEFADGHVPGAVNIPIREVPDRLEEIPTDQPVWIMCASGWRAGLVMSTLGILGYDNLTAYTPGSQGWEADGRDLVDEPGEAPDAGDPGVDDELRETVGDVLRTLPEGYLTNSLEEVQEAIDAGAQLVDVREPDEYEDGFIEDAISAPLRETATAAQEDVPRDEPVIVYCQTGYRASLGLAMYRALGFDNAEGFPGSFAAWVEAGEAVTE